MIWVATIEAEVELYELPHIGLLRDLSYFNCHMSMSHCTPSRVLIN